MSMRSRRVRRGLAASVVVLLMTGLRLPMLAQRAPEPGPQGKTGALTANFDIRSSAALRAQLLQRLGRSQPEDGVTKLRRANDALADAAERPATGDRHDLAVHRRRRAGAQPARRPDAAAPGAASAAIVSGFLETHAALYGLAAADLATLRFLGESVNRSNGLRMLRAEQAIDGIPVFQSDSRFILDRDGRLIRTTGRLVSRAGAGGTAPAAAIPASAAFVSAMQSVGIAVSATSQHGQAELSFSRQPADRDAVSSRLVYFPLAPGVLVLAYEQMTYTDGPGDYLTVVDATTGTLLWRKNVRNYQSSTQQARFSVYVQADGVTPADSPAPLSPTTVTPGAGTQFPEIARTIVNMLSAQDITASPNGWIPDGGTTTTGNNVDACLDRVGASRTSATPAPSTPTAGRSATRMRSGTIATFSGAPPQLRLHAGAARRQPGCRRHADRHRRGAGRVPARRRDAALLPHELVPRPPVPPRVRRGGRQLPDGQLQRPGRSEAMPCGRTRRTDRATNNANFTTPPDGMPGRMQMYRFTGPDGRSRRQAWMPRSSSTS